jgi:farnesyl-diphosphate farnesyltransferase
MSLSQGDPAEAVLLQRIEEAVGLINDVGSEDRRLIREVLEVITSGQELDLQRFGGATSMVALSKAEELDDYTYRVAGCVGEFWTKICRAHLFPDAELNEEKLLRDGVRFGKGLQLVNILRDLPKDLRQHRCYLPSSDLAACGLSPSDLLDSANEPKLRPLYNRYLDMAAAHLAAGWDYTNTLPWSCVRVRLACAWPVLIGVQTLARLRSGNVLDASQRIKVSRADVRGIILRSLLLYPFRSAWRGMFGIASRLSGA